MKKNIAALLLLSSALLVGCNAKPNSSSVTSSSSSKSEEGKNEIVLPDIFKNTNYCNVAITYYSGGVALILDEQNKPDIQNISFEVEFYSIEFEQLPLSQKDSTYFLPFKVTGQVIDDGYLKNGVEYKFWLSYTDSTYHCGISLNDDTLTEPTAELSPNLM